MDIKWFNYFVTSKNSRLTQGHLRSIELYQKILNHDGSEAYCCYFDLDYKSLKLEYWNGQYSTSLCSKTGKELKQKEYVYYPQGEVPDTDFYKPEITFTQYEGTAKPALGMVSFDFDSDDIEESLEDVRKFVKWLGVEDIAVFFSGGKGFHVMVPWGYFPMEASPHYPKQLKDMAKELKEEYPTLDDSIYNYNRKFRVPFTKHDKSGLFKNHIKLEVLEKVTVEALIDGCGVRDLSKDFLADIKPNIPREPLAHLVELFESTKRKSYEIEKAKAGTKEKPSPFEAYDNKLCIKKMLNNRCDDIGRNNACLRIVNDFYRTGKLQQDCENIVYEWAAKVGLPASEVSLIIKNVYSGNANYNFGCQDECKATYCTAKCDLWRKLAQDKRPTVPDAPASESQKLKTDFQGVKFLMQNVFGSQFDEVTNTFSLGSIVKQGKDDLFYYKGWHWQYLEGHKIDMIKVMLNAEFDHKLNQKRLDAIYKLLTTYIPHVPHGVDLFAPKNTMANFIDGTLHLIHKNGQFGFDFRKHNKEDFCTSIIKSSYQSFIDNPEHRNEAFEKWLWNYVEQNDEKFLLVQEMFGATLLPAFPQLFVILGESGTGKSTIMKVLKRLHDNATYICGVSPDKFHGFHMSSMIGKLINIVMDIKTSCRIDDDIVKQIDDGEPIRIERKRLEDVYATIPPVHLFGANKMPATMEAYSGAMKRRFSIIPFNKKFTGRVNKNIANDLFDADPQGILNFALRGVQRLVLENNGVYTKTKSSQDNIESWVKKHDIISQFLDDIKTEGVNKNGDHIVIVKNLELSIKKSELWYVFKSWQYDGLEKNNQLGKMKFYSAMADHGFKEFHKQDGDYYQGLGLESELEESEEI